MSEIDPHRFYSSMERAIVAEKLEPSTARAAVSSPIRPFEKDCGCVGFTTAHWLHSDWSERATAIAMEMASSPTERERFSAELTALDTSLRLRAELGQVAGA